MPARPLYPVPLHLSHPVPFIVRDGMSSDQLAAVRSGASSSSLYWCGALHWPQMRRTSRCATTRLTALETLNASIPMSIMRVMVLGASLVCSVESTKWPVSAALMAIPPVSRSRISPIMMMLGSCRRKAFSAAAKVSPTSFRTRTLVDPHQVVLDRVLGGHDVHFN